MDNISSLLNSISAEDMEKLKSVASSLSAKQSATASSENEKSVQENPVSSLFGGDTADMLMKVAAQLNSENDTTAFIKALRPLLSEERRSKADEAMKFLKLMDALPLLKGMFG